MGKTLDKLSDKWRALKAKESFRNALTFLVFVGIATIFWAIIAMNDSITRSFVMNVRIENVPDSVTFITEPPTKVHVTLRDKGSTLLRAGALATKTLHINFRDFAQNGRLRFTPADLNSAIRAIYGSQVQIGATSLDSISLNYTTGKGKRVPIILRVQATAASGNIISGIPESDQKSVLVYSVSDELDTIRRVMTEKVLKEGLTESTTINVRLQSIPGARLIPSVVKVTIPVEPLVKRECPVTVYPENVPAGYSLLLFPSKVKVDFYVPMSRFNEEDPPIEIVADYNEAFAFRHDRLPVRIVRYPDFIVNPELKTDSVEYTLVRNN